MIQDPTLKIIEPNNAPFVIAAFYKFTNFSPNRLEAIRSHLKEDFSAVGIKGTLLLAPEGVNGTIAGSYHAINSALNVIKQLPDCSDINHFISYALEPPFQKLKVRLKTEIVRMAIPTVNPNQVVGTYVDPKDWNRLISESDIITIDTRNDYEVEIGTFKGSINPRTEAFRQFPSWVKTNLNPLKNRRVAMFCTGGIRCEKGTAYLKEQGFEEVYHLKGGILNYLKTIPESESLWQGECFVFDDRVSIKHNLNVGSYKWCPTCDAPVQHGQVCCPTYDFSDDKKLG